jgi:hypothetical protein
MPKILLLTVALLSACTSSQPPCQGRGCPPPTTSEKVDRELDRAEDQAIRDVIWTMRSMARRKAWEMSR